MTTHRYKIGQLVSYAAARNDLAAGTHPYKIVRLLPFEDGEPLYRIKSTTSQSERVAKEFSLTRKG
jgi:hypothetical protein